MKMDIAVQVGVIAALVLALASIAGGVVLYRGSGRVGWRALGMSAVAGGVGVLVVFALLLTVSSEGQAPEPVVVGEVVSTQPANGPTTSQEPDSPTGMMVPRPGSVDELVMRSNVIVVGTITTVLEERLIGGYGDDGKPLSADDEGGLPFTDYLVTIEDVLKADDSVANSDTLVLRMFGHLSDRDAVITPNVFTLPNPGDYLLFALGRNPDGTYGSGPEGLLDIGGETVAFADGVPFAEVSPEQLIQDIRNATTDSRMDTPTTAKKDDGQPAEIEVGCFVTEVLALEIPMLVTRGEDPIPSGFDAANGMGCNFEAPISLVTVELHRGGEKVFAQEIILDPAVAIVGFPLPEEEVEAIPADLEYGKYDRLIKVTGVDGVVKEVLSDPDSVWLYDPASSAKFTLPISYARKALMFARQALGDPPAIPYAGPTLIFIEPVEWPDTSLGCSKPDRMYAQVITPGFKLVFEYQGRQYEYHTVQDGSTVVECEIRSASTTPSDPPIFFPRQQPASERVWSPYSWAS